MTRTKAARLVVLLLLTVGVFGILLTYWLSVRQARTPVIIVARDQSDIQGVIGSQVPSSYDPYCSLANSVAGVVASGTKVAPVINAPK